VILAGGGVNRAGARAEAARAGRDAARAGAHHVRGKGAFGWDHPLSGQSWLEDRYATDFLEAADVLLVLGSGLGELTSNYHTFAPRGRVIQIEADAGKLEANYPALGIHATSDPRWPRWARWLRPDRPTDGLRRRWPSCWRRCAGGWTGSRWS